MKSYGITENTKIVDEIEIHIESLYLKGFSIKENILSKVECVELCKKLDDIYRDQEKMFGKDVLASIKEADLVRMPFLEDKAFFKLFTNPLVLEIVERILGKAFQLHLQNGIINKPQIGHHQSSWHRDLPYQDWVISKPLGLNAFYCLTDFTITNGATAVLPFSHKMEVFPSKSYVEANQEQVVAPAGSVVFFDSMLYHRASYNESDSIRYGLNNMFVVPIIKQQIDIPRCISQNDLTIREQELLGFKYQVPESVTEFRKKRL